MYHYLQKLIILLRPSRPMETWFKASPFHFSPFLRNLQNRKRPKGPSFPFFFRTVRIFFENFLRSQKSPPSSFLIFCNKMYVDESQRVPPFHFSALCDIFEVFFKKNFQKKISNFVLSRETVIFQSYRALKAHFGCLESVFKAFHEYVLSIFRKLCAS